MSESPTAPPARIVIVGGVAGGMSAATRLRRLIEHATITVFERSGYVSFANCGLPYHVGGVIEDRSALLLQTPQSLADRFGIDVRTRHEVIAIDTAAHTVDVRDLAADDVFTMPYDHLVLSPGARPVRPPIPGIERALALRDIEDTDAMIAAVHEARSSVVIGGGFIGIEVAENLRHRGLEVTIVEALDQVLAPLDPEMIEPIHQRLEEVGISLILGHSVTAIGEADVTIETGRQIPADLVVASIGVRPEDTLGRTAGLELGPRGGILVDDQFRTSAADVYAVGDAVVKHDRIDDSAALVPLAQTANRQGRMVADVIAGRPGADRPVLGTAIVGVCGMQVAATGWNEKRLVAAGRPYRAIHIHPNAHAGYYPGAASISLKLLVDPATDLILGAQGVGSDGVDKRIDVIATAISGGLTAGDLADLELAYAPQFGSAKDPINMLGYIARNLADGLVDAVHWHQLDNELAGGAHLIDVRDRHEFDAGSIPGAINIPVNELRGRLAEVPAGRLITTCAVGFRGYLASRILAQHGHAVANLDGGYRTWQAGTVGRARTAPDSPPSGR